MRLSARLTCGVAAIALISAAAAAQAQTAPAASSAPSDANTVKEVVVTGYRASLANAQQRKEHASQIVDSIVAADIGKLPDMNTAEALQRVTGVQINRDLGEGSTVVVRGLSQVESLENGREMFTASGTRTLNFEFVPSELLAGVDVYKAQSADLIEGGLGGTIDLRLHRPFDFSGFTFEGSAMGNYASLDKGWQPDVSALVSNRWQTGLGEMGLLLSASYDKRDFRENYISAGAPTCYGAVVAGKCSTVIGPNGYYNPTYTGTRERTGFNGAFQWRPTANLELYLEGSYEKFITDQLDYGTYPLPFGGQLSSYTTYPGTNIIKTATYTNAGLRTLSILRDTTDVNKTIAVGGKWTSDRLTITSDLSYMNTTESLIYRELDLQTTVPTETINTSSSPPAITTSGVDLTNPANFKFGGLTDSVNNWEGGEAAYRLDGHYAANWGPLQSIDVGGRVALLQDKLKPIRLSDATPVQASADPQLLEMNPTGSAFGGASSEISNYLVVNPNLLGNLQQIMTDMGYGSSYPPKIQSQGIYAIHERDWSIYTKANLKFDLGLPIDGNIGLRLVDTQDHVTGTETIVGTPTTYLPIEQTKEYAALLPSINLRAHLTDDLFLRFAASKSLTRPEFSQLNPGLTLVPANLTGNQGNPGLKPYRADNYDVSLEYYFSKTGNVYGDLFYKEVTGFPFTMGNNVPIGGQTYIISQPVNSGSGTVQGAEAGYQQFFTFLPGWLSGLGVQGNVTYVDSSVPTSVANFTATLPNLSRWSYNLTGIYEKGPLSARVAWNWRSKFLASIGVASGVGVVPTESNAYGQLDAGVNYDINKHLTLTLEGVNLTQTKRSYYVGSPLFPAQTFQDDTQVLAGVRFKW